MFTPCRTFSSMGMFYCNITLHEWDFNAIFSWVPCAKAPRVKCQSLFHLSGSVPEVQHGQKGFLFPCFTVCFSKRNEKEGRTCALFRKLKFYPSLNARTVALKLLNIFCDLYGPLIYPLLCVFCQRCFPLYIHRSSVMMYNSSQSCHCIGLGERFSEIVTQEVRQCGHAGYLLVSDTKICVMTWSLTRHHTLYSVAINNN